MGNYKLKLLSKSVGKKPHWKWSGIFYLRDLWLFDSFIHFSIGDIAVDLLGQQ